MSGTPSEDPVAKSSVVRPFNAAVAAGIAKLVANVYGETYHPKGLYNPDEIVTLNQTGKMVSVVALDPQGDVIGHYALERPQLGAVAEASDAMVQPEFRHHHILDQMRVVLWEEAIRHGLTGLVGYAVTNHVFTQKAEEHSGASPCGVALGLWPRSFHNMPEPLTQRMSFAVYFKYLQTPKAAAHVATGHEGMIAAIYKQFGVVATVRPDAPATGQGRVDVEIDDDVETATIHVKKIGADTPEQVTSACKRLFAMPGVKALTIEIPLSQTGITQVCEAAEAEGFFFCGLGPAFAEGEDALILQLPREELDVTLVQIDQEFTREMLEYIVRDRARVAARGVKKAD